MSHIWQKQKCLLFFVTPLLGSQQVPGVHGATISVLVSHFTWAALFQVDFLCLPRHSPSGRNNSGARRASSSPNLPNWLESHWGIFILEQIFCPKGLGIRRFLFTLLSWEYCALYFAFPLSVRLTWCCLTLGEMSWYLHRAGASDCENLMNLGKIWLYFIFPHSCPVSYS